MLISTFGYYVPFAVVGSVLFTVGAGLLTTFTTTTPFAKWFGYQVLAGAGVGLILQIPLLAVQTCLPLEDVPVGTACAVFFQTLGGALCISIAQTVFQNGVVRGVHKFVPGLDPNIVLAAGATVIRDVLAAMGMLDQLDATLRAYMVGLVDSFRVALACAAATVVASWFLEWKSVKDPEVKKKMEAAGGAMAA